MIPAEVGSPLDWFVDCLVSVLTLRDVDTEEHTWRVTGTVLNLASVFGVSDNELIDIRYGVMLYSIGKIGIPDFVLHKPGMLMTDEESIPRQHPIYACELLYRLPFFRPYLSIIIK